MWDYTDKVMDHFMNPRNVGIIEDADGIGEVGNINCGDALKLYVKLDDKKEIIIDAKFQTFGCASAIASASALTEMILGKTIEEAGKLSNQDIADYLGALPDAKMHCSVMGVEALNAAIANIRGEKEKGTTHSCSHDTVYDPNGLDRTVCHCFGITERKIREIAESNNLRTVNEITNYSKAGGGCGGCKDEIQTILNSIYGISEQPKISSPVISGELTNLQKINMIQKLIEDEIRPKLMSDGGNVELIDVNGNNVYVRLQGACAGCPSSHVTLKRWIEATLKKKVFPDIIVMEK